MIKPNVLIIGAAKSGTTALRHYLVQHKDVWFYMEEIHYFDACLDKGKDWYFKHFTPKDEKIIAEKTPAYYLCNPKDIYDICQDAKLIMIMRNPVDRAYSEYWMWRLHGLPQYNLKSFEQIVFQQGDIPILDKGKYAKYIKHWVKYFPIQQILFLKAEDLYYNRQETINKVCDFLEIDRFEPDSIGDIHTGFIPTSRFLTSLSGFFAIIRGLNKRRIMWLHIFVVKCIRFIKKLQLRGIKNKYPKMNAETRKYLEDYFAPYNNELYELVGIKW